MCGDEVRLEEPVQIHEHSGLLVDEVGDLLGAEDAFQLGDLVIGPVEHGDASARGLGKGPDRPLNAEADRACVLAALESVSLVTLFDEPTPVELLKLVRPQLYVKGGDYDIETLEETKWVRSWGGEALALPFVDGYSTTSLVKRIRS